MRWTPAFAGVTAAAGKMPALHAVDPRRRSRVESGGNDSPSRSFVFIDILGSFVHFSNSLRRNHHPPVIPAKAGIQRAEKWTPAYAGVTAAAGKMPALHAADPRRRRGESGANDSPSRSFVFIDILGSFVHFFEFTPAKTTTHPSFRVGGNPAGREVDPRFRGGDWPAGRMPAVHAVDPGLRRGDSGGNDSPPRSFVFIDILGSFVRIQLSALSKIVPSSIEEGLGW